MLGMEIHRGVTRAGEVWRLGGRVEINVYGEPTREWPRGRPICQCHNADDAARIVAAVNRDAQPE